MLTVTLGASLLGNVLGSDGVVRGRDGVIRACKAIIRAGEGKDF